MIKDYARDIYPTPIWGSAINAVTTEIEIGKYHLNEIVNNFSASAIINFNNGVPSDEDKDEIERMINDKFCSPENAGRFMLAFNDNRESAVTIERLGSDDFDKRYDAVAKKTRQEIFTAFRANPNLFGIPTENLGFSSEEYESSFKLFNRTNIRPIQKKIVRTFAKIGWNISITPFSLEDKEENVDE
jgi:capsid portal protein